MRNSRRIMRMEYRGDSWCFVDDSGTIKFDQATVSVIHSSGGVVEGFVTAIHGVSSEITQWLGAEARLDLGVRAVHALSSSPHLRRVHLLPQGIVENVVTKDPYDQNTKATVSSPYTSRDGSHRTR